MIQFSVQADGSAMIDLGSEGEVRESISLEDLDGPPALGSLVLHFDFYGRLIAIEVTSGSHGALPPGLLDQAQ